MSESTKIDVNSWLEEELFQQYKNNHTFVDESWQSQFAADKGNGHVASAVAPPPPIPPAEPPSFWTQKVSRHVDPVGQRTAGTEVVEHRVTGFEQPVSASTAPRIPSCRIAARLTSG